MAEEFDIKLKIGKALRTFFHSQFFGTPSYPTQSFADQTVIVTGSNIGLGFEAARHIYRLDAAKLILAVRTVKKGEAAKEDIVRSVTHRSDGATAIEVWPLDLDSTESTLAFAQKAKALPRLDVVLENAGVNIRGWKTPEGFEQVIQVNVVNTFLLALAVLPKLRQTRRDFPASTPHLEIVSSEAHRLTKLPEINAPDLYAHLNDQNSYNKMDRYSVSKVLEVLFVRELVSRLKESGDGDGDDPSVVITMVNPGMCYSALDRDLSGPVLWIVTFLRYLIARTTEVGARTLVHGAIAGPASHGEFMSDGKNQEVEDWILTDVGRRAQKKVFDQTIKVLEARKPGIARDLGL